MKNKFINKLAFSTLTITEDTVWIEDASFTDAVTGPEHSFIGIYVEVFKLFIDELPHFKEKDMLLNDVAAVLADQNIHTCIERKIEPMVVTGFVFNLRAMGSDPNKPFEIPRGYSANDIVPVPREMNFDLSFTLSSTREGSPMPLADSNNHGKSLCNVLGSLALRYQYYLHARVQKAYTEKGVLRCCELTDATLLQAARQALLLMPGASEYEKRTDLSIININRVVELNHDEHNDSSDFFESKDDFWELLGDTQYLFRDN